MNGANNLLQPSAKTKAKGQEQEKRVWGNSPVGPIQKEKKKKTKQKKMAGGRVRSPE